jgi:hypothetical protein
MAEPDVYVVLRISPVKDALFIPIPAGKIINVSGVKLHDAQVSGYADFAGFKGRVFSKGDLNGESAIYADFKGDG